MFKQSYETLYNSAPTGEEMVELKKELDNLIGTADRNEISKVTSGVVRQALAKLKPNKTDVSSIYVSDSLKNAPDLLHEQLASIFRS